MKMLNRSLPLYVIGFLLLPNGVAASPERSPTDTPEEVVVAAAEQNDDKPLPVETASAPAKDLNQKTDQEIGELLRAWPELSAAQRRDLLAEVRVRMRRSEAPSPSQAGGGPDIKLRIKKAQTQHRYGQSVTRSNGSARVPEVVIQAKVTHIMPDGSRVTTTRVMRPNLRKESPPTTADTVAYPKTSGATATEPRRRVVTTVRFGAGFERRTANATPGPQSEDAADSGDRAHVGN